MPRTLGDAFVRVRPDASRFPGELRADLARSSVGRNGIDVPVSADMGRFASTLRAGLNRGPRKTLDVPVTPDMGRFNTELRSGLNRGPRKSIDVPVSPDMGRFGTELKAGVARGGRRNKVDVPVGADTRQFSQEVDSAVQKEEGGFRSRMKGWGAVAGAALGGAAVVGVASFAKRSVGLEQQFGKTMSVLQATLNLPASKMQSMDALAMKMGADTVFSASDASKAMLELARGGMSAATIQGGALKGTMTLAAAGELNMGEAANTAVKAMGAFHLKGKDMGAVAAALAGAANASASSVHDLSVALQAGGLAAHSVGFSLQETTGILAAFSNEGLNGSDAGTSLKTMLSSLTPSTAAAVGAFQDLGIMTKDGDNKLLHANGTYKSAAEIAETLRKGTRGLSDSQRNQAITAAFGSDAQRAANIMIDQGGAGIRKYTKAAADQNAANKQAAANMKGTQGAIEGMKGSLETASLAFGQAISPITVFGAHLVQTIANGSIPLIQQFGKVIRGELGHIDLSGITRAMKNVDLTGVFRNIASSLKGIDWGSASKGLGSIGASLRQVDWRGFRQSFGKGASDTISVFSVAIGFLARHLDLLARVMPALIVAFAAYKAAQAASNLAEIAHLPIQAAHILSNFALARSQTALAEQMAITNGVERVGMLTQLRTVVVSTAQRIATIATAVATRTYAAAQWVLNAALNANPIAIVITLLLALGAGLVLAYKHSETFRKIVNGAWAGIKAGAQAVAGWFTKSFIPFFTTTLPGAFRATMNWVRHNWPVILAIITGPLGLAVLATVKNWGKITGAFKAARDWVKGAFQASWNTIQGVIMAPVNGARDLLKRLFGSGGPVRTTFSNVRDWVAGTWRNGWNKVQGVIMAPVNTARDLIRNLFGGGGPVRTTFTNVRVWLTTGWGQQWSRFRNVIMDPLNWARDKIGNLFGRGGPVRNAFSNAVDGIRNIWSNLRDAVRKPIAFVVNTVFNHGIVPFVNGIPFLPNIHTIPGWESGGFTGPGAKQEPAGVVHKGEWVSDQETTSRARPLLEVLHRTKGRIMGFLTGGGVGGGGLYRPTARGGYGGLQREGGFNAVDIGVPQGTPVHAAASGRVTISRDLRGHEPRNTRQNGFYSYGRYIQIHHSQGNTIYAHLVRRLAGAGLQVRGGELIGYSGHTGHTLGRTGDHVHFGANGIPSVYAYLNASTNYSGRGSAPGTTGGGGGGGYSGPTVAEARSALNPGRWLATLRGMGPAGRWIGGMVSGAVGKLRGVIVDRIGAAIRAANNFMFGSAMRFDASSRGVWKALRTAGWGQAAAAGIMGNMQYESSFSPTIIEGGTHGSIAQAGSRGYGLVQWTPATKLARLLGGRAPTVGNEVAALTREMRGGYGGLTSRLQHTRSPVAAAMAFLNEYERPKNRNQPQRGTAATALFNRFARPGGKDFDGGGMATGRGALLKNIIEPERTLSPRQTETFDRFVGLLERWDRLPNGGGPSGGGRRSFIENAVIRETVDLERYERLRAFHERRDQI